MIVDKVEDTNGFKGLYGEVVQADIYKLKELDFIPDIIYDIGANIGVFTRFARELFPDAIIVAIEPDLENYQHFMKFTEVDENMFVYNFGIGIGQMYRHLNPTNGGGESYVTNGLGYPLQGDVHGLEQKNTHAVMLDELIDLQPNQKSILKLDIEGNENQIWVHEQSMKILKKIDYICAEIHFYALTAPLLNEVREKTMAALNSLEETHDCELNHIMFYARKK